MLREPPLKALELMLSFWGLDLSRYTAALTESFLARWPDPASWVCDEARDALIATFAIGETTFLRHPEHFATLRALLPEVARTRSGALRAFSAGCASGEEAYSLAATLAGLGLSAFELMAWDVNPDAIERARLGEYRPWSLRGVDSIATEGWLEPSPCGVRVADFLRQMVSFEIGNLCLDNFPQDLDVIFCRNVLLYFRPEAAQQVLARFAQALRPGGLLFLGYYDPRPNLNTGLSAESRGPITYYRKPLQPSALHRKSFRPPPSEAPPRQKVVESFLQPGAAPEVRMEHVRQLANRRRTGQALSILRELNESIPLHPTVHVLTALVAEDAGDMPLMLRAARRACFLLPDQPAPNYFLSVAFARNGELRRASVHRRIAAHSMRTVAASATVLDYSEGLTAGQLRRLIGGLAR